MRSTLKDDNPSTIMRKFKRAVTDSETCVRFDRQEKPGISNLMEHLLRLHRKDL